MSSSGWLNTTATTAMQVMRYNLSVAYALRSEWEKANNLLKEVGYICFVVLKNIVPGMFTHTLFLFSLMFGIHAGIHTTCNVGF